MRRTLLILSLLLFLCACSPAAEDTPAASPSSPAETPAQARMPCTLFGGSTAAAEELKASLSASDHSLGPEDAAVTILIFNHFQCEMCAYAARSLTQVRQLHPDQVRIVFHHLPLPEQFDKDLVAIQAVEAAGLQGKFWEMHDLLFQEQSAWINLPAEEFQAWTVNQASSLGLDPVQYQADLSGEYVRSIVEQAAPLAAGSTPTVPLLFVNSTAPYTGPIDFPGLEQVVALDAMAQDQFTTCPEMTVDPLRQYLATLHTGKGDIVIQLYADRVPNAVNSFVHLANSGWYDGVTFYKVTSNLAQSGDPSGTGLGNPGYLFPLETAAGLSFDCPGVVALMNDGMDTNGSRFFITFNTAPQLDGRYTIIGQVLSGMDILSALTRREVLAGQYLPPGDPILQISIEEK